MSLTHPDKSAALLAQVDQAAEPSDTLAWITSTSAVADLTGSAPTPVAAVLRSAWKS